MASDSVESINNDLSSNEDLPKVSDKDGMEANIKLNLATHALDPNMDARVVETGVYSPGVETVEWKKKTDVRAEAG